MLLKDIIENYYNENNGEVKPVLKAIAQTNKGISVIYHTALRISKDFNEEDLIFVCDSFGLKTTEDLDQFNKVFSKINLNVLGVERAVDLGELDKVPTSVINVVFKIHNKEFLAQEYEVYLQDREYYLFPSNGKMIKDILESSRIHLRKYISEKYDCDNYARDFKSWLSSVGYGNIALGVCDYIYEKDGIVKAHAINIAVTDKRDVILIEPQLENYWSLIKEQPFHPNHSNMKIRKIIM